MAIFHLTSDANGALGRLPLVSRWPRLPAISGRELRWLRTFLGDARRPIPEAPGKPDPKRWSDDRITAAWLGHATVLINFFGITILTDPVLAARAGISLGFFVLGPKRYVKAALAFRELPAIDLVLLSHAHMDHFDLPTLRRFGRKTQVVTARNTRDLLRWTWLRRVSELHWGEKTELSFRRAGYTASESLEVEAFEVNHWGARLRTDDFRSYNGYVLRRRGRALIFGGDTANTTLFRKLRGRGGTEAGGLYDLAVMPIGAYNPWINSHCTPEQAVTMADEAGAQYLGPIHHQTFRLSQEPMGEPIARLEKRLAVTPQRIAWRQVGDTFVVPAEK